MTPRSGDLAPVDETEERSDKDEIDERRDRDEIGDKCAKLIKGEIGGRRLGGGEKNGERGSETGVKMGESGGAAGGRRLGWGRGGVPRGGKKSKACKPLRWSTTSLGFVQRSVPNAVGRAGQSNRCLTICRNSLQSSQSHHSPSQS